MEDLSAGFKLLRNSLVLWLVATLIPLISIQVIGGAVLTSGDLTQVMTLMASSTAACALSSIIGLISLFFMYKGWQEMCHGLDEAFCMITKVIKYGVIVSILALLGFIAMTYSSISKVMENPSTAIGLLLASSPLLLVAGLASLAVFLAIVYAFYKLGGLLSMGNLKIGAALLLIGPLTAYSGIFQLPMAITLLALIILIVTLNKLVGAEVEVVEEEPEEYGEYKEIRRRPVVERRPPRRPRTYDTFETTAYPREGVKEREHWEEHVMAPKREEGAQLVGPNGFIARLGPGIRTFGRRDFAGYVPDEDLDYISRRHFEIKGTSQGYYIRDLGSLNGTWVNGRKLERGESVKLTNGAVIDVAEVVRLRFVSSELEDLGVPTI